MTILLRLVVVLVGCVFALAACGGDELTTSTTRPVPDDPCVNDGARTVTVPDVIGKPLREALEEVDTVGLTVVDRGVIADDPADDTAIVRSQEPPAGHSVLAGACIGFRTENPAP